MDCDAMYVGQTGRKFGIRMKEHKKSIMNKNLLPVCLNIGLKNAVDLEMRLNYDLILLAIYKNLLLKR